jgi:RHS repeat-associated protein
MHYRARWYDPAQGRFVSEDPIGLEGGINFYAYVANDSVDYTDPLGLKRLKSYNRTRHANPAQSCVCNAEQPDAEDDSFLTLLGSYGIGVANGFGGAAIGTVELPIDLVKDPTGTNKLTSRTLPNGVVTISQYDGLDRLTRLTHAKGANTLADFQYQFNAVNNITQMTDGAGSHNYTYDSLDRLSAATHPNQTNESYTFDDVGNRTASQQGSSYTYQAFNRLTAANSNSYGYDVNGNLTSETDASGSWIYTWDYENRLKQASKSGGVTVTYAYDALGRRVQQTSSAGGTTKFVYDGADVIRDLDASGGTIVDYLNGPGIDNKLRQTASGGVSYFATDHLGTTRALVDASGGLTSTLNYDSFGKLIGGSASTRYTYAGREIDSDTGLMHYRARWYDPQAARFMSEDPIGFLGRDVNLYGYVKNSPLFYRDPSGLQRCDPIVGAILGAGVGGPVGFIVGGLLGPPVGAALGGATFGIAGTFAEPGGGTVLGGGGGAAAGAAAGATAGPWVGGVIGAGIGGYLGYKYCSGDDACERTDTRPWSPNPPQDDDRDKRCNRQLYEVDYPTCDGVGRVRGPAAYAKCIASAHQRYAACLRGLPLPPLDTWNN